MCVCVCVFGWDKSDTNGDRRVGGKGIWEREGSIAGAGYLHRQKWIEYGEQVKSMILSGSMDGEGIIPGHIVWLGIKDSK